MARIAELVKHHRVSGATCAALCVHQLRHEYKLINETGPAHSKTFVVRLVLTEHEVYDGSGASIKKAQQAAARTALDTTSLQMPQNKRDTQIRAITNSSTGERNHM